MSGRDDQDGLKPQALRAYETEERELIDFLNLAAGEEGDTDAAVAWLDRTLYRHREQAYALGVLHTERSAPTWWERNWFGVVILIMMAGSLLAIGLTNGWS